MAERNAALLKPVDPTDVVGTDQDRADLVNGQYITVDLLEIPIPDMAVAQRTYNLLGEAGIANPAELIFNKLTSEERVRSDKRARQTLAVNLTRQPLQKVSEDRLFKNAIVQIDYQRDLFDPQHSTLITPQSTIDSQEMVAVEQGLINQPQVVQDMKAKVIYGQPEPEPQSESLNSPANDQLPEDTQRWILAPNLDMEDRRN